MKLDRVPSAACSPCRCRLELDEVVVHYEARHDVLEEWGFNGANIDAQKIIWARDMGEPANQELLQYYKDHLVCGCRCTKASADSLHGTAQPASGGSTDNELKLKLTAMRNWNASRHGMPNEPFMGSRKT